MSQNLGSTKYDSEELLTEELDIARFTKVVDNEVEKRDKEANISTVAWENVLCIAHRLWPVLDCRFLTRNLLRMLGLCYLATEGVRVTRQMKTYFFLTMFQIF